MACEPRPCAICGSEFVPKSEANIYCSFECSREAARRKARYGIKRDIDTFSGGLDPDESAMRAVWALDDGTRRRLRLLFAPRITDAIRIWMEDGE